MARYEVLPNQDESGYKSCIMRSEGFLETLKLAWYVIRYPSKTGVCVRVDENWTRNNLTPQKQSVHTSVKGG